MPSHTALAICCMPAVQSPAAKMPGTLVARLSSVTILPFAVSNPNFLESSNAPAVPQAMNSPSNASAEPSSNTTRSKVSPPSSRAILRVSQGRENCGASPLVSAVTSWMTPLSTSYSLAA